MVFYHYFTRKHFLKKGSLIERRGIIIVLNVKEIAKIPQEVSEHIVDFSQCR